MQCSKWLVCIYQKWNFGFGFWYKFTFCRKRGIETGFWLWLLHWTRCNLLLLLGIKRKWMSSVRKGRCSGRLWCQVGKVYLIYFFDVWIFSWVLFERKSLEPFVFGISINFVFHRCYGFDIRRICPVAFITLILAVRCDLLTTVKNLNILRHWFEIQGESWGYMCCVGFGGPVSWICYLKGQW